MHNTLRWTGAWLFPTILVIGISCGGEKKVTKPVTDWFELRGITPTISYPHFYESGRHMVEAWMKSGSKWQRVVDHAKCLDAYVLAGGNAVLISGTERIFFKDGSPPRTIPCETLALVTSDGQNIVCSSQQQADQPGDHIQIFAWNGDYLEERLSWLPESVEGWHWQNFGVVGVLADMIPVFVGKYSRDGEYFIHHCVLFSVGKTGATKIAEQVTKNECSEIGAWRGMPGVAVLESQRVVRSCP